MPLDANQSQVFNLAMRSPQAAEDPMKYAREIFAPLAVSNISKGIAVCNNCDVKCKTRTLCTGPYNAQLMVIMDYPTQEQANLNRAIGVFEGAPLVEKFLRRCFASYHADFDQIFFMNTVNCCPSRTVEKVTGTEEVCRTPKTSEIKACSTFMKYAIDAVHPPMIILMGAVASNVFEKAPVSKIRGTWLFPYTIPAMVTYSPHELLWLAGQIGEEKRQAMMLDFKKDVGNALDAYKRKWPDNKLFY
jgi:uracil-DNA glycosylase family 4